jgi:hypothetical protein
MIFWTRATAPNIFWYPVLVSKSMPSTLIAKIAFGVGYVGGIVADVVLAHVHSRDPALVLASRAVGVSSEEGNDSHVPRVWH